MQKVFCRSCLSALLIVAATPSGAADPAQTAASSSHDTPSAAVGHDEVATPGQFSRGQWNLNETEWTRYQTLMRGVRGSVSPATLSPIEVLGIHAQTEAERKDYARRWAKGQKLPLAYRNRIYVVDHRKYGLRYPPRGHHYVRVGNDVVLTAIATGVIASVVFALFED